MKVITEPFTVAKIQGSILKDHLCDKDYLAPHKVITSESQTLTTIYSKKISIYLLIWQLFASCKESKSKFEFQCTEHLEARCLVLEEAIKEQEPHVDSDDKGKLKFQFKSLFSSPYFQMKLIKHLMNHNQTPSVY